MNVEMGKPRARGDTRIRNGPQLIENRGCVNVCTIIWGPPYNHDGSADRRAHAASHLFGETVMHLHDNLGIGLVYDRG